ncbi:MAG: tetratricopeptide repeat protein [Chitinophagales bacterium]
METQRLKRLFDFLEKNPTDTFVLFAIAQEYFKQQDFQNAEKYFRKLIEVDENYGGAYYHLAKVYESTGAHDQAVETYKKGIEVNKRIKDMHTVGELQQALTLIEDDAE